MPMPARRGQPLAHIVHNDKDLRIDAGPQDVAKGDPPRRGLGPETNGSP